MITNVSSDKTEVTREYPRTENHLLLWNNEVVLWIADLLGIDTTMATGFSLHVDVAEPVRLEIRRELRTRKFAEPYDVTPLAAKARVWASQKTAVDSYGTPLTCTAGR